MGRGAARETVQDLPNEQQRTHRSLQVSCIVIEMDQNKFAVACVSLLYCGAMSGPPPLLYLWLLAGTPVSLSAETLVSSAPVLAGILGGRAVSYLAAFVWGLAAGAVTSLLDPSESTEAPSEEANHDPLDCQSYTRSRTQLP